MDIGDIDSLIWVELEEQPSWANREPNTMVTYNSQQGVCPRCYGELEINGKHNECLNCGRLYKEIV